MARRHPYLTEGALFATLGELARFPGGAEVVFDYANPPNEIKEGALRDFHREMAERVAASGEPFRCYLDTPDCTPAPATGFAESRTSTTRRLFRAIYRTWRSLRGPGRADTLSGWGRANGRPVTSQPPRSPAAAFHIRLC